MTAKEGSEQTFTKATNVILHDAEHPSAVILPVVAVAIRHRGADALKTSGIAVTSRGRRPDGAALARTQAAGSRAGKSRMNMPMVSRARHDRVIVVTAGDGGSAGGVVPASPARKRRRLASRQRCAIERKRCARFGASIGRRGFESATQRSGRVRSAASGVGKAHYAGSAKIGIQHLIRREGHST